MFIIANLPMKH